MCGCIEVASNRKTTCCCCLPAGEGVEPCWPSATVSAFCSSDCLRSALSCASVGPLPDGEKEVFAVDVPVAGALEASDKVCAPRSSRRPWAGVDGADDVLVSWAVVSKRSWARGAALLLLLLP